jgi:hypothetical protein
MKNYGTDTARSKQAGQGSNENEMDKKNDQIAYRRIVAGKEILWKFGRNDNSPATGNNLAAPTLVVADSGVRQTSEQFRNHARPP